MGVNQVKFGDATVMDISDSTVAPETLLSGVTAYNKAGNKITGEMVVEHVEVEPILETGTKSATITVGEESADIYCENTKTEVKNMKTTQSATIANKIAQFECIDKNFVKALKLAMEPIQDLHGYDHPWAGGADKNKLPITVANLKSLNTSGTWSGDTYTFNGGTFTVLTDAGNNVIGIKINGTFNAESLFYLTGIIENNGYIINGCTNGSSTSYRYRIQYFTPSSLVVQHTQHATNGDYTLHEPNAPDNSWKRIKIYIWIANGYIADNVIFYPMIRLATETDATFVPYSNICPISGRTEASVTRTGKNLISGTLTDMTISSAGKVVTSGSGYNLYIFKSVAGVTYIPSSNGASVGNTVWWTEFENTPQLDSVAYNNTRNINPPFTATINGYIAFRLSQSYEKPQVDLGLTITAYEPPVIPETHTHKYQQEILGGVDDFVNGELSNEWTPLAKYNGSEAWVKASSSLYDVFYVELADEATGLVADICSDSTDISIYSFAQMVEKAPCISIRTNLTPNRLHIAIPNATTVAECKAYLAEHNLQVCYKKATPTAIKTTAEKITTVPGVNVISATEPISECSYRVLEENLSDTIYSNETLVGEDSDVYAFRNAPDISDANYVEENMVGGSVVWNQLVDKSQFPATTVTEEGITYTNSGDGSFAVSGTASTDTSLELCTLPNYCIEGHKYLVRFNENFVGSSTTAELGLNRFNMEMGTTHIYRDSIVEKGSAQGSTPPRVYIIVRGGYTANNLRFTPQITDLTAMFGSAVADYIYNLENTTARTGVAFLKKYGFFTKDYYDYDAGSLQSVNFNKWFKTSKNLFNLNRMQGVDNIIDGNDVYVRLSKNANQYFHDYKSYIPGNRTYTLQFDPPSDLAFTYATLRCRLKDNSDFGNVGAMDGWTYQNITKTYYKSFENASHAEITVTIPDCLYCEFGIGTNNSFENIKETGTYVKFSNIQLEVGSEATDYEPYEGYEISLDDDLDLRGLFRIVDDKLIADGDIYEGDGKITRKYGIVDLGDLTWTYEGSETPTRFRATLPLNPKILGSGISSKKYIVNTQNTSSLQNGEFILSGTSAYPYLRIRDDGFTSESDFTTAVTGIKLLYELAEPILNRGTNFDSPQVFIPNGNEYFVKTYTSTPDRDFDIPAGHVGKYYGKSMFKEISLPTIPKSGGTYILKCNVLADGNKKLYWCADNN